MSFIAGGKPLAPPAAPRADKGTKRIRRAPKAAAIELLREQIAVCERKIADVREAEATLKILKPALAALEGGK